jgi:hypothetical protein
MSAEFITLQVGTGTITSHTLVVTSQLVIVGCAAEAPEPHSGLVLYQSLS